MNSLTVKALTAFIVTTGLVLMWTPVVLSQRGNQWGFNCTEEQHNTAIGLNNQMDKCLNDKHDRKQYDLEGKTPDHCCATFESHCTHEKVFTKVGCKSGFPTKVMNNTLQKCKQNHGIDITAAYCATLPAAQKPVSDGICKEYIPCDPLKLGPVDTQNNGGSGGGSGGAGAGDTTTKKSSATSPKVNALLMTFIAITGISLLFVV